MINPRGSVRLQRWIELRGITQIAAARALGLSPSLVSRLVSGSRRRVSLGTAIRIQYVAGIPAEAWTVRRQS